MSPFAAATHTEIEWNIFPFPDPANFLWTCQCPTDGLSSEWHDLEILHVVVGKCGDLIISTGMSHDIV